MAQDWSKERAERNTPRCRKLACGTMLIGEIELDTGLCSRCADREYEAHIEHREFEHYHPQEN